MFNSVFADAISAALPAPNHSTNRKLCRSSIREAFEKFHARNPEIYGWIVEFAYQMKGAGYKRYGMKSIIERVRWHVDLQNKTKAQDGDQKFKINNNFAPFYARLVMQNEPALKGFFELREQAVPDVR